MQEKNNIKSSICEIFAECNTVEEVAKTYAEIMIESNKQLELMCKEINKKKGIVIF